MAAESVHPSDTLLGPTSNGLHANGPTADQAPITFDQDDDTPGMSSFMEKLHGVTERDSAPARKRKTPMDDEEDMDETQHKKTHSTFNATNGSTLSAHLKDERTRIAKASKAEAATIDLTSDASDTNQDDDLLFIREEVKEVCLGKIIVTANMFCIPRTRGGNKIAVTKEIWPSTRLYEHRVPNVPGYVINLIDGSPESVSKRPVGTLDYSAAQALCPLLDGGNVNKMRLKIFLDPFPKIKGEIEGSRISRGLKASVLIFSPKDKALKIGLHLSQRQFFLLDPPANYGRVEYWNPQRPPQQLGSNSNKLARKPQRSSQPTYGITRTEEEMRRDAANILDQLFSRTDLPQSEPDPDLVRTPLMSHQKQALHFMTAHERADQDGTDGGEESGFSLWRDRIDKKGRRTWYNIITNHEVSHEPAAMRGGILADMMGLGKTLSILSLLVSTSNDAKAFGNEEPSADLEDVVRNAKATLIICPKSVLSNWQEQVKQHTKRGFLSVYSYHGPSRTQDVEELASYDIVLTSYSTAASEFSDASKRRNALASIQWFRIVLDEAHTIRTQSTNFFQSCRALEAQRRWAVTGTPVQNNLDDLAALIRFLRLKPFEESGTFAQHVIGPMKSGKEGAEDNLKLIVQGITLRRMKDTIGLTNRNERVVRLEFSPPELVDYEIFSRAAGRNVRLMTNKNGALKGRSYAQMLKMVHRLRTYCAHGREMMREEDMKELEGQTESTAIELGDEPDEDNVEDDSFITERAAYDLLEMFINSSMDLCTRCNARIGPEAIIKRDDEGGSSSDSSSSEDDDDENDILGHLTTCSHLICPNCKQEHMNLTVPTLRSDHYHTCPYDGSYVRFGMFEYRRSAFENHLERMRNGRKNGKAKWDESNYSAPHTKVKALLNDLKASAAETAKLSANEEPIRSVVFSGWTTYLDLIEYALDENRIGFVRLDGTMSLKARANVIEQFKSDPTITVMLISIKAGGQGINLVAANKVYMMEPQFNPGVEQQAIDRVHRLGQKRDVEIVHYIMKDSVEVGMLDLQDKKNKLAAMATEKKRAARGEDAKKRSEELVKLLS